MNLFLSLAIAIGSASLVCATIAPNISAIAQTSTKTAQRKTAVIPPALVGIWASNDSVLKGVYLHKGQAIYLGADGVGAIVVGEPAIGIRIEAVFDAKRNTIDFDAFPKDENQGGSIKYDPKLKTLDLRTFNGKPVAERVPLKRRFNKFTDETRRNLGM